MLHPSVAVAGSVLGSGLRVRGHCPKTADARVRPDQELLRSRGEVLGADTGYVRQEDGPLPRQVEQRLHTVQAFRQAQARSSPPRALGRTDPEDPEQSSRSSSRTKRPRCATQVIGVE